MVVTPQAIIITVSAMEGETVPMSDTPQMSQMPSRKRRLSHLSYEEKMHRKKLKNRVAAQTSRDKKKARMEELENAAAKLMSKEEKLLDDYASLRLHNDVLSAENESLKKQLQDAQATNETLLKALQDTKCTCNKSPSIDTQTSCASPPSSFSRPAESLKYPLQKGIDGRQTTCLRIIQMMLMTVYLLSQTSSQTWKPKISQTCATWSALQRASSKMPLKLQAKRKQDNWIKWWGRHQKTWNPVDQLSSALQS